MFKNFKSYPAGQWSQQSQVYRNGAPSGPPQTETLCASPLSASQGAAIMELGKNMAPTCKTKVLVDEERTAEYEQMCSFGPQQQVIHTTLRAIDDRTTTTELRQTISGQEMSLTRITSRYVGACTAGKASSAGAGMPAMPQPSAEECARIPAMKQDLAEAVKNCSASDVPESYRATCKASMQGVAGIVQQLQLGCKK